MFSKFAYYFLFIRRVYREPYKKEKVLQST